MKEIKKYLFPGPYFPNHNENLMEDEGNVSKARKDFISSRFNNLGQFNSSLKRFFL